MTKIIRNDFFRFTHSFWNVFFMVILPVFEVLFFLQSKLMGYGKLNKVPKDSICYMGSMEAVFTTAIICILFTVLYIALCMSMDISSEVLNNLILSGNGRKEIFFGRLISTEISFLVFALISSGLITVMVKTFNLPFKVKPEDFNLFLVILILLGLSATSLMNAVLFISRNIVVASVSVYASLIFTYIIVFVMASHEKVDTLEKYILAHSSFWIVILLGILVSSNIIGAVIFNRKELK